MPPQEQRNKPPGYQANPIAPILSRRSTAGTSDSATKITSTLSNMSLSTRSSRSSQDSNKSTKINAKEKRLSATKPIVKRSSPETLENQIAQNVKKSTVSPEQNTPIKCRRYKLSAEVREAAQNTLRSLQTIQSNATKEELAETQALVAAYQQRSHPPSTVETVKKSPKLPNPADLMPSINPSPTQTSAPQYTTTDTSSTVTAPSPSVVKTPEPTPQVSNADLDAKVDDMLSLIRATEERMAAASYRSVQNTRFPPLPISTTTATNTVESGRLGHSTIRASAVAAAAAHMHDEEDEESIVSRIEQVAAFEEAASKQSHTSRLSPPPPPPPLPQSTTSSSFQRVSPGSSVDLDLDSRIEMLITGPKAYTARDQSLATAKTNLPSSLLARRQAIADKVAAKKAGEMSTTVSGKNRRNQPSSKDDELYDLLGV